MSFRQAWDVVREMSDSNAEDPAASETGTSVDEQSSVHPERKCTCGNILMQDSEFCRKCGRQGTQGEEPERKRSDCSDLSDAISQAAEEGNSMLTQSIARQIRGMGNPSNPSSPRRVNDDSFYVPDPRSRGPSDASSRDARARGQSDHSTGSGPGGPGASRERAASDGSNASQERSKRAPTARELADLRKTPPAPLPSVQEADVEDSPVKGRPGEPAQRKPSDDFERV